MYNRYIPEDPTAFRELYTRVEPEQQTRPVRQKKETGSGGPDFRVHQLVEKLKLGEIGLFPLLVLALLLLEADEEERIIMLVLAAILGI